MLLPDLLPSSNIIYLRSVVFTDHCSTSLAGKLIRSSKPQQQACGGWPLGENPLTLARKEKKVGRVCVCVCV